MEAPREGRPTTTSSWRASFCCVATPDARSRCRELRSYDPSKTADDYKNDAGEWDLARLEADLEGTKTRVKAEEARLKAAGEWDADEVNARASKTADGVTVIVRKKKKGAAAAAAAGSSSVADAAMPDAPSGLDAAPAAAAAAITTTTTEATAEPEGAPDPKRQRNSEGAAVDAPPEGNDERIYLRMRDPHVRAPPPPEPAPPPPAPCAHRRPSRCRRAARRRRECVR